ncbi:hypothetical protein [Schlesneria sp. DSM 10557]|uniref:hypothetical protein n=1 Tax=Schlesneria sp. DSM 10557 TaxID=3044399 RepID=UPI0035A0FBB5
MHYRTASYLIAAAIGCAIILVLTCNATVVPLVARGAGPDGVQVTSSGWLALLFSALGTGGFTLAGIVAAILSVITRSLGGSLSQNQADEFATEIVELTSAFAALMKDKTNRAAQRRFFFAFVDATSLIHGCTATYENGVVILRYTGHTESVEEAQA